MIRINKVFLLVVWIMSLWLGALPAHSSDPAHIPSYIFMEGDISTLKAFFYQDWNENWKKDKTRDKFKEFLQERPCSAFSKDEVGAINAILKEAQDPKGDGKLSPIARLNNSKKQTQRLETEISLIDSDLSTYSLSMKFSAAYRNLKKRREDLAKALKKFKNPKQPLYLAFDNDLEKINEVLGKVFERQKTLNQLYQSIIPTDDEAYFKGQKPATPDKRIRTGIAQAKAREKYYKELGKLQVEYGKLLSLARPEKERRGCTGDVRTDQVLSLFGDIDRYFQDNKSYVPVDMFTAKNERTGEYDGRKESTANSNSLKSVDEDESPLRRRSSSGSNSAAGAQ